MAPINRYPPFPHLQQQPPHQSSHLQQPQHPTAGLQGHSAFSAHHAFGAGIGSGQNGGLSIFGPQSTSANNLSGGYATAGLTGSGANSLAVGQAAQMGFAHAGVPLQQALNDAGGRGTGNQRIKEVWRGNLDEEMAKIRLLIDKYPYVSMDTEFPGIVARPIADDFGTKSSYHYQTLRCNVDLLKIIQLGLTFFNADGEVPSTSALEGLMPNGALMICPTTWTFNFKFSLEGDMYNEDSITLLKKAGCDFDKLARDGIDEDDFGSLLITSGLPFLRPVHWISFHSGYDFGYLMKCMYRKLLPKDEENYRRLLKKFFPNVYDVKFMLRHAQKSRDRGTVTGSVASLLLSIGTKSGLQDIADELSCARIGSQHTAGSDAWLTGLIFFELRRRLFDGNIPDELNGQMWGITGVGPPAPAAAQAAALAAISQAAASANGTSAFSSNSAFLHRDNPGAPSTPTTNPAGLASQTPGAGTFQGGTTGAFGNFQYGK